MGYLLRRWNRNLVEGSLLRSYHRVHVRAEADSGIAGGGQGRANLFDVRLREGGPRFHVRQGCMISFPPLACLRALTDKRDASLGSPAGRES